jgi:hypothetical protein
MKQLLLICAVMALVGGCASTPKVVPSTPKVIPNSPKAKEESAKVIEAAIRKSLKKPEGELTKADLGRVTVVGLRQNKLTDVTGLEKFTQLMNLDLYGNHLTDVKGLEKLDQLRFLNLYNNPALTKAQIDQLKKALPKCIIISNPTK